jgi:hypothetical protein
MNKIISDKDVFSQIKDKSKKAYAKLWMDFKLFSVNFNSEEGPPGEDIIIDFFKHLRLVKKSASTLLLLPQQCVEEEEQLPAAVLAQSEDAPEGLRD